MRGHMTFVSDNIYNTPEVVDETIILGKIKIDFDEILNLLTSLVKILSKENNSDDYISSNLANTNFDNPEFDICIVASPFNVVSIYIKKPEISIFFKVTFDEYKQPVLEPVEYRNRKAFDELKEVIKNDTDLLSRFKIFINFLLIENI